MKIYLKYILLILFIIGLILIIIPNQTFARNPIEGGISDIVEDGRNFLTLDGPGMPPITDIMIKPVSDYIYNVLLAIGIVLALAIGIILGIQFILGSIEEQAKIKEALIPYVIACIIIFGGFTIWKIVVQVGEDFEYEVKWGDSDDEQDSTSVPEPEDGIYTGTYVPPGGGSMEVQQGLQ